MVLLTELRIGIEIEIGIEIGKRVRASFGTNRIHPRTVHKMDSIPYCAARSRYPYILRGRRASEFFGDLFVIIYPSY